MTARFPQDRDGWRWLATALFETGRFPEALAAYRRHVEGATLDKEQLAILAGLCLHAQDFEAAARALDAVAAIDPDHPDMLQRRALLELYRGQLGAAEASCRRCLARDPENVPAWSTLTRARRGRLTDGELATLDRLAERAGVPQDLLIPAAFAAGHARDARGDIDPAFASYRRAHELALERDRAEGRGYLPEVAEARIARLPRQLDCAEQAVDPALPRPIFIVGMPRSGTTLVESVLGAHPEILPGGERMQMRQVLQTWLALDTRGGRPDAATLAAWRDHVLRSVPVGRGARCFTDKHPRNLEAVGLIARLFPEAAIVWMRRDPLETGLSIYRQEFNKQWDFVHRLADIGHYFGLHERAMTEWQARLPGRIVEVRYEAFAADFGRQARTLVEAVGLSWDPRCLEFQSEERPIATFSTVDARDPVTVRRGRAARYRRHLGELLDALAAAGVAFADPDAAGQDDAIA